MTQFKFAFVALFCLMFTALNAFAGRTKLETNLFVSSLNRDGRYVHQLSANSSTVHTQIHRAHSTHRKIRSDENQPANEIRLWSRYEDDNVTQKLIFGSELEARAALAILAQAAELGFVNLELDEKNETTDDTYFTPIGTGVFKYSYDMSDLEKNAALIVVKSFQNPTYARDYQYFTTVVESVSFTQLVAQLIQQGFSGSATPTENDQKLVRKFVANKIPLARVDATAPFTQKNIRLYEMQNYVSSSAPYELSDRISAFGRYEHVSNGDGVTPRRTAMTLSELVDHRHTHIGSTDEAEDRLIEAIFKEIFNAQESLKLVINDQDMTKEYLSNAIRYTATHRPRLYVVASNASLVLFDDMIKAVLQNGYRDNIDFDFSSGSVVQARTNILAIQHVLRDQYKITPAKKQRQVTPARLDAPPTRFKGYVAKCLEALLGK